MISELISSGILNDLKKGDYLTVGFPKILLEEIKGTKLAERRVMFDYPEVYKMKKIYEGDETEVDTKTISAPEV